MNIVKDNVFIFDLICKEATERLAKKKSRKGYITPNYCTIALLYQAIIEEIWAAADILTKVRTRNLDSSNPFGQVLSAFTIKNSLPPDTKASSESIKTCFPADFLV